MKRATIQKAGQQLTETEHQFWFLTCFGCEVLRIFRSKVEEPNLLPKSEIVIRHRTTEAIKSMESLVIRRAWIGNMVWLLTIMLCAAHTTANIIAIDQKMKEVKRGIWGGDLLRLTQVVHNIRRVRQ